MSVELVIMTIIGLIGVAYFAIYRAIVSTYQEDFLKKHGTLESVENKSQGDPLNQDWESSNSLPYKGFSDSFLHRHKFASIDGVDATNTGDFSQGFNSFNYNENGMGGTVFDSVFDD